MRGRLGRHPVCDLLRLGRILGDTSLERHIGARQLRRLAGVVDANNACVGDVRVAYYQSLQLGWGDLEAL